MHREMAGLQLSQKICVIKSVEFRKQILYRFNCIIFYNVEIHSSVYWFEFHSLQSIT